MDQPEITINILAFGVTKEIFGKDELTLALSEDSTATDLKNKLETKFPRLKELASYLIAINNEYAKDDCTISQKDEIALIPPVSGG